MGVPQRGWVRGRRSATEGGRALGKLGGEGEGGVDATLAAGAAATADGHARVALNFTVGARSRTPDAAVVATVSAGAGTAAAGAGGARGVSASAGCPGRMSWNEVTSSVPSLALAFSLNVVCLRNSKWPCRYLATFSLTQTSPGMPFDSSPTAVWTSVPHMSYLRPSAGWMGVAAGRKGMSSGVY